MEVKRDHHIIPSTTGYRAVYQRNAMYDQFLKNTTNRLQEDLRSTMRTYTSEKERLVHQLAHLHATDHRTHSSLSTDSSDMSSVFTDARGSRKFFRAPNIAAMSSAASSSQLSSTSSGKHDGYTHVGDKRWREKRDAEKIKKEREMLKLPVIHSASSRRSEWDSGRGVQGKSLDNWSGIDPLPGISAARELLSQSMKIPSIYDPDRSDTIFDTNKSRKERKKVTFADQSHHFKDESRSNKLREKGTKNSEKHKGTVPKLNLSANQFTPMPRPTRPRRTSMLPPLEISPSEVRKNPARITDGVNNWKSMYGNIVDAEERTRALTDILNAVRLKKFENEQAIKYGEQGRPEVKDDVLKNFLMMNANERIMYRDEQGNKRRGFIPTSRRSDPRASHSRASNHSTNLQGYMRKMSRSRCSQLNKLGSHNCSIASFHDQAALTDAVRHSPVPVEA